MRRGSKWGSRSEGNAGRAWSLRGRSRTLEPSPAVPFSSPARACCERLSAARDPAEGAQRAIAPLERCEGRSRCGDGLQWSRRSDGSCKRAPKWPSAPFAAQGGEAHPVAGPAGTRAWTSKRAERWGRSRTTRRPARSARALALVCPRSTSLQDCVRPIANLVPALQSSHSTAR